MRGPLRNRPRLVFSAALLAVQAWSAVGVPIFHGEAEVLASRGAFESGHSDRCAVLHLESRCTVGNMHLAVGATARDLAVVRRPVAGYAAATSTSPLVSRSTFPANTVRAPPLA